MDSLKTRLTSLEKDLDSVEGDAETFYMFLLDRGGAMPAMQEEDKTDETRVASCLSTTWFKVWCEKDLLYVVGDSEAKIMRGFLGVVHGLLHKAMLDEMRELPWEETLERLARPLSGLRQGSANDFIALIHRAMNATKRAG